MMRPMYLKSYACRKTNWSTCDPAAGTDIAIGSLGGLGFPEVQGRTFDASNTLYGADINSDQLVTIVIANGTGALVGSTGNNMQGLAFQ